MLARAFFPQGAEMRKLSSLTLAVLLTVQLIAAAVTLRPQRQESFLTAFNVVPKVLPSSAEDVFTADVYLDLITLTNVTDTDVTVTVSDKQTIPMGILSQVNVPARSIFVMPLYGRYCPSGVTWAASANASIVGTMRGRK
jgi:hypothetical protein